MKPARTGIRRAELNKVAINQRESCVLGRNRALVAGRGAKFEASTSFRLKRADDFGGIFPLRIGGPVVDYDQRVRGRGVFEVCEDRIPQKTGVVEVWNYRTKPHLRQTATGAC
jgi:hypothetical protein